MTFQELLEENFETREYSGRGMGGKYCLAITIPRDALEAMFNIGRMVENQNNDSNDSEYWIDETGLDYVKSDNLGYDIIIYWPNIPFKKEIEE
jgi:hypothetical protein